MNVNDPIEIAPGLYASFDGWHVKLVQVQNSRSATLYLGPQHQAAVVSFVARLKAVELREQEKKTR